jgi:NitT/TauT family transport system substrate-binding protein
MTTHAPLPAADPSPESATSPTRRALLRGVGVGVGALALGGAGASLLAACAGSGSATGGSASAGGKLKPVKLGWWGASCEAPLFVAYHQGFFAREGLRVELVNLGQSAAKDAIASGKVDGAPGITFEWLKPIEQGQDIRVTGGLHGGCLRLVAAKGKGITTLADLKGTTIATDQIGGSAHSFFTVVLAAAGIDPTKDVTFVAYPGAQLETALTKGDAVAVAAADPFPFLIVSDGKGTELASNLTGSYKDHFCCAIGLNGALIDESPATAAAVTRGWLSAAAWIGSNPDQTAKIEVDNKYVPIDAAVAAKLLSTYTWKPSVTGLKTNIAQYTLEFSSTGILDRSTDPKKLAEQAFKDVTGGDGGINPATPTGGPAPSSTALGSYGIPKTDTYALTSAQRQQLLAYACHHGSSPAGRV